MAPLGGGAFGRGAGTGMWWPQFLHTAVRPPRKSANSNSRPQAGQLTRITTALPVPDTRLTCSDSSRLRRGNPVPHR
jgi:hypothetical protein